MSLRLITDHEVNALLPYMFRYSVAILQIYPDIGKCQIGSGSLIKIKSHYFVATAAHNLRPHTDEHTYIGFSKEHSTEQLPFIRRWPQPTDPEPDIDLGFIEISPDRAIDLSEKTFLPLSRISPFINCWENRVFLCGFPSEYIPVDLAQKNTFNLNGMGYLTETINPKSLNKDAKDVSRDIFIDYDEVGVLIDQQEQFKMPQPYGISGGGLWALPILPHGNLWSPEGTVLIGIERSWLKEYRIAVCTQMQFWLRLIAEKYSDLTSGINDHLKLYA